MLSAGPEHVDAIHALIRAASETTTVLPRTPESIRAMLGSFAIAVRDEQVVGCGALHAWTPELAEVRSLVVSEGLRGQRVGSRLVDALVGRAAERSLRRVFTLTDNPAFFARLGFNLVDRDTLPHKVWNDCLLCPKFDNCGEVALDRIIS